MSTIAFIPARSGSSRLKNKNIMKIKNRPLIYWTVSKAIKCKSFDRIIFSSDSLSYYKILIYYLKKDNLDFSKIKFDYRASKFSRTKSKIFDYLKSEFIKKNLISNSDLIVQLLPTYALRSINSIKKAIHFSITSKKNCFSACEYDFHITFGFSLDKINKWKPVFKKSPMITGSTQSQSQKKYFHPSGVINCLYVRSLSKNIKSIYQGASPVILPRGESFDIDTEDDLKIIKKIF